MRDTPETDAAEMPIDRVDTVASRPCHIVNSEFARKLERERDEVRALYNELIMNVVCAYDCETRHQTALRYIREREERDVAEDMEA